MAFDKRNWILAGSAIALLFVLAALLAALSGERRSDMMLRRPSTFFTDPSGARGLFLVMKKLLPATEQWRHPLTRLPRPDTENAPSTLIVAGPLLPLAPAEAEHLDRWLSHGGQLILASANGWPLRQRKTILNNQEHGDQLEDRDEEPAEKSAADQAAAKLPSYLSTHAPALQWSKSERASVAEMDGPSIPGAPLKLQLRRYFRATGDAKILAGAANAPLAVELPIGQGRIVAVADPMVISNGALRAADNAVWLVTLAAAWGNGIALFDEYHHGFGAKRSAASLVWAFSKTPWGWCLWQIVATGLLYIFVYRRRFGRVCEPPTFERSSPLDQVDARAGIFRAAGAQRLATHLMVQNLSQELSQAHGRTIDVTSLSAQAGKRMARQISPESLAELQTLAAKAERGEKLSEHEFIEIGRLAGELSKARKDRLHHEGTKDTKVSNF
jgi:hypothetical protein